MIVFLCIYLQIQAFHSFFYNDKVPYIGSRTARKLHNFINDIKTSGVNKWELTFILFTDIFKIWIKVPHTISTIVSNRGVKTLLRSPTVILGRSEVGTV